MPSCPTGTRRTAGSQPHRALWDTIAAALLLPALAAQAWPEGASLADLLRVAEIAADGVPTLIDEGPAPRETILASQADTLF